MSNYTKLKTNLKLTIQRLKLLEKKKTELSHKSRKEIADYLSINKVDRAKIRVEHIIREDNFVEAMEMLEMFCDLLLARFGLIEKMKELDPGLDEAIATIIWAAPRVSSDVQEFKIISDILSSKYGKNYAEACKTDALKSVNEKVKKRLGIEPPSKRLVEQYLVEIAKNYNVNYLPDVTIMSQSRDVDDLIIMDYAANNSGGNNSNNGGGGNAIGGFGIVSGTGGRNSMPHAKTIGFDVFNDTTAPTGPMRSNKGPNLPNKICPNTINPDGEPILPTLPPPLPATLPSGEVTSSIDIPAYPQNNLSFTPPPTYKETSFDKDENDYNLWNRDKPPLNGPIVVSDPNVPLPYKPGGITPYPNKEPSPPPVYREKQQQPPYPNTPTKPSAPPRSANTNKNNYLDLPSVPDDLPTQNNNTKSNDNNNNNNNNDEDINFDDLQKRFQNLKKL